MYHDVTKLDLKLAALRERRRAALADVAGGGWDDERRSPFDTDLLMMRDELRESDDPVGRAIAVWLDVMDIERRTWTDRVRIERSWIAPHRVPHLDDPASLRELRRKMLRETRPGVRATHLEGFIASAQQASDHAVHTLVWRLEREGDAYFAVDGEVYEEEPVALTLAKALVAATDDIASDLGGGLLDHATLALGLDATEGWPARLTFRWLSDVFAPGGLVAGLQPSFSLPQAWGAMSFARAMGLMGAAVLDASRPESMPFSIHKSPRGHRQHARRMLFAQVVTENDFARRVLGLGRDRVRTHQRHVSRALCHSLRFDALRVLVSHALLDGQAAGRERFREITDRHFGGAADPVLIGVFPRLRPADGPALVGAVTAFGNRRAIMERHDEDWYRNPHAIEMVRHENAAPTWAAPPREDVMRALGWLTSALEDAVA